MLCKFRLRGATASISLQTDRLVFIALLVSNLLGSVLQTVCCSQARSDAPICSPRRQYSASICHLHFHTPTTVTVGRYPLYVFWLLSERSRKNNAHKFQCHTSAVIASTQQCETAALFVIACQGMGRCSFIIPPKPYHPVLQRHSVSFGLARQIFTLRTPAGSNYTIVPTNNLHSGLNANR